MSNLLSNENSALYTWLFNKGVELLARREHSRAELQNKLKQKLLASKQWQGENIENLGLEMNQALMKLEEYGYLSDERFAKAYVNGRCNKGYGSNRIKQELKHKGISDALIESLSQLQLECATDGKNNTGKSNDIKSTSVYRAWAKKFNVFPQELKERAKQQRFLIYRGFGHDEISALFEHLKANITHE